jgi:hypothetical protein
VDVRKENCAAQRRLGALEQTAARLMMPAFAAALQ